MGRAPEAAAGQPGRLARFNAASPEAARRELLACCASAAWAELLAAGRPYAGLEALLRQSDAAVAAMTAADLAAALAGHPRIGERAAVGASSRAVRGTDSRAARSTDPRAAHSTDERPAAWSRQEQSGMRDADPQVSRSLAELNLVYEERFDHIYLVCATGRSAPELLALLRDRLGNDPESEWLVVRSELQKINQLRLRRLLAAAP
jgi:2-oxo-4-hydroxy-4-carboxy-5-ureidoimidazoline decarboxylase